MQIHEIGQLVQEKRTELGLTQDQLGHMASVSRATINGLENGNLPEIGFSKLSNLCSVLAIDLTAKPLVNCKAASGLKSAVTSTNVSYKHKISVEQLRKALASGNLPKGFEAQLYTLVDETPWPLVAQAVRETASVEHVLPKNVWKNLTMWAEKTKSPRWNLILRKDLPNTQRITVRGVQPSDNSEAFVDEGTK